MRHTPLNKFYLYLTLLALAGFAAPATTTTGANSNAAAVPFTISPTDSSTAPPMGALPTPGTIQLPATNASPGERLKRFQVQLDLGREQRKQKSLDLAQRSLSELLTSEAPAEIKRQALFELALVAQDDGKFVRAEQIFSQYMQTYSSDPSVPEVLLRQGLIYRQMGVNGLAISKFYAVMSTALKLKLDNLDYYKKIVLQSQIEIADTFYQEGHFAEASDFYARLLKSANVELDRGQTQFKLINSLSHSTNYQETVAQAENYLALYTNSADVPQTRFILASALKSLGHNNDSMRQVLLLLQSQQDNVNKNPEVWSYWQRRAGTEIANLLYKEGDYVDALQIFLNLGTLDKSPAWQLPVRYQTGLVYEQLQQWPKATQMYDAMLEQGKELTDKTTTPTLTSLLDMAKWRKEYIAWMQKARVTQQAFVLTQITNSTHTSTP